MGGAFDAWDADPAHAKHPARDLKRPFFTGSPFDQGVKWRICNAITGGSAARRA